MPFVPPVVVAALIVRDVPSASSYDVSVLRINAILLSTRRRTRCCDAQGASAVVFRKNAILPPVVVAALIVRECLRLSHKCHHPVLPVVVPVVVMLSAPVP